MSAAVRLASFCRLCLSKTKDKVPVFADGNLLDNLLQLIEIQIDPDDEPEAVVCYDCVVTMEGFHQFKSQCHVNDEFVKTIPPKLECSASSTEMLEEENEEEEEDGNGGFIEDEGLEEEDCLELSEAEEVFQEIPQKSPKSKKKKTVAKSTKKRASAPVKKPIGKAASKKQDKHETYVKPSSKLSMDELQVLAESYPDYFYFEKGSRSIYYTLVFYGERFNSALFTERSTYWQCIHRRKYQCPAQVWATNDYKTFERRYEHTHGQLPEKEGQTFTPHEALPELFQICKRIVSQKRGKNVKQEVSFEAKFQEFAEETSHVDTQEEVVSPVKELKSSSDSDEKTEVFTREKRKIKPNVRYANGEVSPKKRSVEQREAIKRKPEEKPKKRIIKKSESDTSDPEYTPKKRAVKQREPEKREPEIQELENSEPENDETIDEVLDLDKIEEECDALKVPKRPTIGPGLEEMLVLADSYPDFFFFEKGPRSIYFTLVYYGERFHSALFTEHYTYWQCRHRRKYKCPAQVCVTNDYKTFERRYEHTHPDLPDKEGEAFTPLEALPELFEGCRRVVLKNRAKRRKKLLDKYKFLQTINSLEDHHVSEDEKEQEDVVEVQDDVEEVGDDSMENDLILKDVEYIELIEEVED